MKGLIDRLFLLLIGIGAVYFSDMTVIQTVAAVLIMFVCFCLGEFFEDRKGELIIEIMYGLIILLFDGGTPIFLLLIYESVSGIFKKKYKSLLVLGATAALYCILMLTEREYYFWYVLADRQWIIGMLIFGAVLATYLAYNTVKVNSLWREKLRLRDDSEEVVRLERSRRALMAQQQDSEISMATLRERNRIAREIHDNVGHLLSRCILQLGAIVMVHKGEPVAEELKPVQEGLNESMTSIRNSVHNLHNEALDLKKTINNLAKNNERFTTTLEYDVDGEISMKIKYCIIAVITEGYQNANKHSNGDKVDIVVREHPGMYQLIFQDNGICKGVKESGIGLHNMEERVRELGGTISFLADKGFRIFISIPKEVG